MLASKDGNQYPRKILGYQSAGEIYEEKLKTA